ncbi:MAG: hypothetical protein SNJ84_03450 [Verrucomicrobiia bacterium]
MRLKHPWALVLMVGLSAMVGLAAVGSLLPALFSPMLFDAPGSTQNVALWVVFVSVWAFPLVSGVSVIGAWLVFAAGRPWAALLCFLAPLVPALGVVGGLVWIEVFHGGQFAGG